MIIKSDTGDQPVKWLWFIVAARVRSPQSLVVILMTRGYALLTKYRHLPANAIRLPNAGSMAAQRAPALIRRWFVELYPSGFLW